MRAPLRLGIVGLGYMGSLHLEKALAHPSIQVTALYDTDEATKERLRARGLPVVESYEALLDAVEAVIIASPTATHFSYAELALRARKHLLIEKPVTTSLEELNKLIFLWEEAGTVAIAGHIERFNPAFQALLPYAKRFTLFHFERVAPWTPRGSDASAVMDLLIHDLDLFWALTEGHLSDVRAGAYRIQTSQADSIQVWIDLVDGRAASFLVSRVAPYKRRRLTAHGAGLWAEADLLHRSVALWEASNPSAPAEFSPLPVEVAPGDALSAELEHFLQCISEQRSSTLSLEHVYSVMVWAQQVESLSERHLFFTR
ncbi:MAG: Gfo/Idh/MocA family oxidoreductase [Bacteroidia bacterium]|nr:Gfo/Idh/MocA family oxidoreductase [Bacteroidia bacterium]